MKNMIWMIMRTTTMMTLKTTLSLRALLQNVTSYLIFSFGWVTYWTVLWCFDKLCVDCLDMGTWWRCFGIVLYLYSGLTKGSYHSSCFFSCLSNFKIFNLDSSKQVCYDISEMYLRMNKASSFLVQTFNSIKVLHAIGYLWTFEKHGRRHG